jgi:hypothetical protein
MRIPTRWLVLAACAPVCAQGDITTGIDAEANLPYWEYTAPGMSVRLVQRLPDQTRAFFMARGFGRDAVERIARSCVFQTVFQNTSNASAPDALEYDLRDWVVQSGERRQRMMTREDWAAIWAEQGAPKPARIAFEWALFPTRQTYNPGDYNWGMSIFGLEPGNHFDLTLVWTQYGERHTARIEELRCAPDSPTGEAMP